MAAGLVLAQHVAMALTFVLVHGHWHGSWAWDSLTPVLERRGHRVVAPQLPSDRLGHGAAANAAAVIEACDSASVPTLGSESRTVLVGHSAGGLTIPLVARRYAVRHMVFVAALIPVPGRSVEDDFASDPSAEVAGFTWRERDDGLLELSPDVARRHFFHDCAPELADTAIAQLRLQTPTTITEPSPLDQWPHVTSDYIVCSADRVLAPKWQQHIALTRLGVEPTFIDAGHSPALACPDLLADAMERLAGDR